MSPSIFYYCKNYSLKLAKGVKAATESPKPPKTHYRRTRDKRKCLKTLLPTKKGNNLWGICSGLNTFVHTLVRCWGYFEASNTMNLLVVLPNRLRPTNLSPCRPLKDKSWECAHGLNVKERHVHLGVSVQSSPLLEEPKSQLQLLSFSFSVCFSPLTGRQFIRWNQYVGNQ